METIIVKLIIAGIFTIILAIALVLIWKKTMKDYNIIIDDY